MTTRANERESARWNENENENDDERETEREKASERTRMSEGLTTNACDAHVLFET